jgi:hypothetical protein
MRSFKKFRVLAIVVFALSALGAANASAAIFTATATGEIAGQATEPQVFTVNGGQIKCLNAALTGTIKELSQTQQEITIKYSSCTAFGFNTVDISSGTFMSTTSGQVHVLSPITITPTFFGASVCTVTIGIQTTGPVSYINNHIYTGSEEKTTTTTDPTHITTAPLATGITYTSSGGPCGASGNNGTYSGNRTVARVGGGVIQFDP